MKALVKLSVMGYRQIIRDGMLLVLIPLPLLVGLIFKIGIPLVNSVLEAEYEFSLENWYGMADGLLICLSPLFTAMIMAFLLLDERDEGLNSFYQITPLAGSAYLTARIVTPLLWSFIYSTAVIVIFHISKISFVVMVAACLLSSLTGGFLALMIVAMAANRVEGLAVAKLTGLSFLGLILIWMLPEPLCYLSAFLPSFWIGKLISEGGSLFSLGGGLLVCGVWIFFFLAKYQRNYA